MPATNGGNTNPCPRTGSTSPLETIRSNSLLESIRSSRRQYADLFECIAEQLDEITTADEEWCEDCEMCAWTHDTVAGLRRRLLALSAVLQQHADR